MNNEKNNKPGPLLAVLGGYFVVNSVLLTAVHNTLTKIFVAGIDVILAATIIFLLTKLYREKQNKH